MKLPRQSSIPAAGRLEPGAERLQWQIASEVPVALMFNSSPHAVMMASPADLEDFAVGFTLSEGLAGLDRIKGVLAFPGEDGYTVDVALDGAVEPRRRAMEGRSGCGLCGVEEIAQVLRPLGPVTRRFALSEASARKALDGLRDVMPVNALCHSVHGAAFATPAGDIVLAREDVGRHNALDKLLGALARAGTDMTEGFVAMTSRCSFELVQKAALMGISHLVTLSAPTSMALELARVAGVTLGARAGQGIMFFEGDA
jgi:FdhD protein